MRELNPTPPSSFSTISTPLRNSWDEGVAQGAGAGGRAFELDVVAPAGDEEDDEPVDIADEVDSAIEFRHDNDLQMSPQAGQMIWAAKGIQRE